MQILNERGDSIVVLILGSRHIHSNRNNSKIVSTISSGLRTEKKQQQSKSTINQQHHMNAIATCIYGPVSSRAILSKLIGMGYDYDYDGCLKFLNLYV